ncbi:Bax inhibitor-1/YccA family protein [Microcella frigidaquae]|uniref:Putative YccA/Bax inhibitor family protein n=1 Tax=Microcella frigidaquae TaxID=424758 RepID=A0A840X9G3_9MICO|nr:Bax inhibitor-1/YccA family protein [Microcella frigidaquae]MBB5617725.1 putative YccA/Bax inhibitor family protein [Microcella frigidaquae]MCA1943003.1 Bax inhibitor-1/YccA family protein [Microcella sp.]NHN45744.1 Bax inhibitor-1/YccA family protein [Microcella frigidaquae]
MATSNPAFSNSPAFSQSATKAIQWTQEPSAQQLDELYARSAATPDAMGRMTYENTIQKTVLAFVVLLATAAVGWFIPALMLPAAIVGFVLALVNIFKKEPSPALVLAYTAAQGLFVGGISMFFESAWPGIVTQAVIGTFAVVGVTLALFASGKIRASKRATQIFLVAMIGYAVFSLINMGLMLFGVTDDPWGLRGIEGPFGIPLGVIIGVFVILLAAYSLVLDFDAVKTGVERGAPAKYGWTAAFGIMVTVIWLYLEILRLLAILRGE